MSEITIDVDALRKDLINYFGSASTIYPIAGADLVRVTTCSDNELVTIAINNGFNLSDYEITSKHTR